MTWNNVTANVIGIMIYASQYNTVEMNLANDGSMPNLYKEPGIYLGTADNSLVENNNATNNYDGIYLEECSNNTISKNNFADNSHCGITLFSSSNNTFSRNNVTGNANHGIALSAVSSYNNVTGNSVSNNYDGIWLSTLSNNNALNANTVTANTEYGINVEASLNNSLNGNTVTGGVIGLYLSTSSNYTSVAENSVSGAMLDIVLDQASDNNTIDGNTATGSLYGIGVADTSSFNTIAANNVTGNQYGVALATGSDNNTVLLNTVAWNSQYGIYVTSSTNFIYHNSFLNNTVQAYVDVSGVGNMWNDTYPSGGNYWSDYKGTNHSWGPRQNHPGPDGFGDSPYPINASNSDNYPLMQPWSPPDMAIQYVGCPKTVVCQNYTTSVYVNVTNLGNTFQNVTLDVYANTTLIYTHSNYLLLPGFSVQTPVTWNTTGLVFGNYTVSALVEPVPGEADTSDNTFTGGWVFVAGVGDLTGGTPNPYDFVPDGKVLIEDVSVVSKFFGQKVPPAPANADLTGPTLTVPDGKIQIDDVATVSKQFGQRYRYK